MSVMVRRLIVDAENPSVAVLDEAARAIRGGAVVAIPTDTLYGLAADPFQAAAVEQVFRIKGRTAARALPLIAADIAQIEDRIGTLSLLGRRLAERFWPGPLTLLMPAPPPLAPGVAGDSGRVGVRVPAHTAARRLCAAAGTPLTATSANLSGEPASSDPDEVVRALKDRLELLVDAGVTPGGAPSTIVDLTGRTPALVRAGSIPWEDLQAWLRKRSDLTIPDGQRE